ncbi:YceI family protein [Flavobacterium sp.]|uniref:YceI family protein n=1 Tax=Flavobacterium sp. TaxID=239 RepID=UPI0037B556EC
MKKIIGLLVFYFIITPSINAQNLFSAELQKNSSLTISGSTNLLSFKIYQKGEKLSRNKLTVATTQSQNKLFLSQNQLSVVVKNFDSNNCMALKDFLKMLKSDTYPTLQVQINYFDLQPISEKGQTHTGNALVSITITGITKHYTIPISLSNNGDIFTVNGNKKLSIHDFGLTPENKMMGLIKVSEWINIDFNMICKIYEDKDVAKL